jgi:hypothetical protein
MPQILIEENFRRIDGQAMTELIEAFDALGVETEPTQPRTSDPHGGWVLVLYWLSRDQQQIRDSTLTGTLAEAVRRVFSHTPEGEPQRSLPQRIEIREDHTGKLITTVPVG